MISRRNGCELMAIDYELKENRAINAARNTIVGFLYVIIVTVCPFVVRTIMGNTLGTQYLGLNSVFASIIQILNIAGFGFGSVIVYFLYKPAAEGNDSLVAAYLRYLKKIYAYIGIGIIICGIAVLPFLHMIAGEESSIKENIHLLFLVFVLGSALSYFVFPEIEIYIIAYQRNDLNNTFAIISWSVTYIIQIVGLIVFKSYYVYVVTISIQIVLCGCLRRHWGKHVIEMEKAGGMLPNTEKKAILKRTAAMIGHTLDVQLINGIDSVVISIICGLTSAAVYGNYFIVFSSITMVTDVIYQAVQASIGNAVAVEEGKENILRFRCLFWLSTCLGGLFGIIMLCTYQTFMKLWMPNLVDTSNLYIVICIYFYISQMRKPITVFKNAGGMWEEDKYKPYVAVIVNLILDIVLIRKYGINGAITASIITIILVEMPWETYILFKQYFKIEKRIYLRDAIMYGAVNLLLAVIIKYLIWNINIEPGIISLIICAAISMLGSLTGYILIYRKTEVFEVWRKTLFEIGIGLIKKKRRSDV